MRFVVRAVAILILGSFLLTSAFAEEAAKASNSTPPEAAPGGSATSTGYLAPAIPAFAPQAKAKSSSSSNGEITPVVDLFVGYQYVRFSTDSIRPAGEFKEIFNWQGITGSIAGNVNRWFSLVADVGALRIKDVPPNVSGSAYTFLFGPRFSHRSEHWTPFVHALFGAARLSDVQVTAPATTSAFFNRSFSENAFASALGGGLDANFNKHISLRIFQAEWFMTHFHDGGDNRQHNLRASTGLVLHFGGNPPPPPPVNHQPAVTLTANPTKVVAGSNDAVVLQAQCSDQDNDPLSYKWSATGGGIDGSGAETRWNSSGAKEGAYTVTVVCEDGRGGSSTATANITVEPKPNNKPIVSSCDANPATILVGDTSTVTTKASDPDNDPLTYSYTTSGGRVTGSGESAQFNSTGVAPGTYTITCSVSDGRGGEASSTTQVNVKGREIEKRLLLHSIYFPTGQPTEANPDGGLLPSQETTLNALAADFQEYVKFKPDAHLILHGHADPRGGAHYDNKALSDRRVARTKSYLVQKGVSPNAIETEGLGVEEPMNDAQVRQALQQDQELKPEQKTVLLKEVHNVALAQSRRVDVTLSTTRETSVRQYPLNAADALNLIDPKGVKTRAAVKKKTPAAGRKTAPKKGVTKKAPPAKK